MLEKPATVNHCITQAARMVKYSSSYVKSRRLLAFLPRANGVNPDTASLDRAGLKDSIVTDGEWGAGEGRSFMVGVG